jgi:hypothetical protein
MENMSIINKIPKDKHFFPKIRSENTNEVKSNRDKFNCIDDFSKEEGKYNQIINNYILKINDDDFWTLINTRLNLSNPSLVIERVLNNNNIEYWHFGYLIEVLFLQLAKVKEILNYNGKKVSIYKYYNQALRMWKWIPISKPKAIFVVYASDLTPRIYCELKSLDKHTAQYVLKESAKRIFENIDFKFYHEHIENNLEVVLED